MTLAAALWASSSALTGKVALASLTSVSLFGFFDGRRIAFGWCAALAALAVICSAAAAFNSPPSSALQWTWVASAIAASIGMLRWSARWSAVQPRTVFDETSAVDATRKAKGRRREDLRRSTPQSFRSHFLDWGACMLTACALGIAIRETISAKPLVEWSAVLHAVSACVLLGVAIFSAIELTFSSAPDSLKVVYWNGVAWLALSGWALESTIAAAIVLSPIAEDQGLGSVALSRMLAMSIMLINFVVWMIAHRIVLFQRTGKVTAWVSLSLAAWIAVLSLATLCALPSDWPWAFN